MNCAAIPRRGVTELIQRCYGDVKNGASDRAGWNTYGKVGRAAGVYRDHATRTGNGTGHIIGRCDGLITRSLKRGAESSGAASQRSIGRQHRLAVATCQMDGSSITGRRIVRRIERGHRKVKRASGRRRRWSTYTKVGRVTVNGEVDDRCPPLAQCIGVFVSRPKSAVTRVYINSAEVAGTPVKVVTLTCPGRDQYRRFHRPGRIRWCPPGDVDRHEIGGRVISRLHIAHADVAKCIIVNAGISNVGLVTGRYPTLVA